MTEHPYWTVLTIATSLITLAALVFLGILCFWAATKCGTARDQRAWARATRIDRDAESRRLAEERP